ncbi:MAG: hypothetical protein LBS54_04395 [Dysgonamonadaceae bacterium]|nr:hypothetical protein [Dysgonamonadaceae bacterium]
MEKNLENSISKIEAGINTYVENLVKLITVLLSFGTAYNPNLDLIKIPALQELVARVRHAINEVDYFLPRAISAESERQDKFALLLPLVTRVQAIAIVFGLPHAVVEHIKELVRKMRGHRRHKLKPYTQYAGSEPEKHISVSQVSFTEQIEHFTQLVMTVASEPLYDPSVEDLKVSSLEAFEQQLGLVNDAAIAALQPLADARMARDKLLYSPETGMMEVAIKAKEYVKAVFGANSPQYKEVWHIKFVNKKI